MSKHPIIVLTSLAALAGCVAPLPAETVLVPGGSFETPATPYVSINIDSWEKSPKPDWYVETGGFLWIYLTGLFKNTSPESFDHIDNCDGNQALWFFAVPEVALFQDHFSMDWNDPAPPGDFDARYEVAKSYHLTVGVIGGGGNMADGATLEISLYYRDAASNRVTVAATSITNSAAVFSTKTHLVDFDVNVATVKAGDGWAGHHIGVQFLSTVTTNLQGGYWDLDNVRLIAGPALLNSARTNGEFHFTLRSEPGLNFEILATTDLTLPTPDWTRLATLTNVTGVISFTDTAANGERRYYRAQEIPQEFH